MLATVEEFREMVPGAAAKMTDDQIEDFIWSIEALLRGFEGNLERKREARIEKRAARQLKKLHEETNRQSAELKAEVDQGRKAAS